MVESDPTSLSQNFQLCLPTQYCKNDGEFTEQEHIKSKTVNELLPLTFQDEATQGQEVQIDLLARSPIGFLFVCKYNE